MASDKQIAANRENSLKSTGPTSATGRARSSRNSTRHGLLANCVTLDSESRPRFFELLRSLQKELRPAPGVETTLVETMAVARWRQLRAWDMERAGLQNEMEQLNANALANGGKGLDPSTHTVFAFRSLVEHGRFLDLVNRYAVVSDLQYDRALRRLHAHREKKAKKPNEAK